MGKKIGGWCLVLVAVCGFIMGLLLLIGGLIESENRFRVLVNAVIVMSISFSFLRLGWSLRAPVPNGSENDPSAAS